MINMATAARQDQPFMSSTITTLNDDLLFEIFFRFPNRKSLIQCSIVCKRWFSLISLTQFMLSFNQFRHNRNHNHYSNATFFFSYDQGPHFHKLISNDKSKITSSTINTSDLPFPNAIIRASCEDLMLVSREGSVTDYYICNPFTRQWLALPSSTLESRYSLERFGYPSGYYFICKKPTTTINIIDIAQYKYRVGLLFSDDLRSYVFCSESGLWSTSVTPLKETRSPSYRRYNLSVRLKRLSAIHDVVASNGVLYYLGGLTTHKGIIASEPGVLKGHFIPLPGGFSWRWRRLDTKGDVRLGVVRGQLRLLQLLQINQTSFGLKIWELIDHDDSTRSWLLVHDVKLNGVYKRFELAFHPNNGNMIFAVHDRNVYLYDIEKEEYEKVSEFSYSEYSSVAKFLNVFTIMQP